MGKQRFFSLPKKPPAFPHATCAGVCFIDSPGAARMHPEASAWVTSAIAGLHDFKQKMTKLELIWEPCLA